MTLRCDTGCDAEWFAAAPGTDNGPQGNLFFLAADIPMQVWCLPCWQKRFRLTTTTEKVPT